MSSITSGVVSTVSHFFQHNRFLSIVFPRLFVIPELFPGFSLKGGKESGKAFRDSLLGKGGKESGEAYPDLFGEWEGFFDQVL